MYPLIREYILSKLSKNIVSAIVASKSNVEIGSPCIIDFGEVVHDQMSMTAKIKQEVNDIFEAGGDVADKLNRLIYNNPSMIAPVRFLFPSKNVSTDMIYTEQAYISRYYCVRTLPIIKDLYRTTTFDNIHRLLPEHKNVSVFTKESIKHLDNCRYVNYVINNICKSNFDNVYDWIYGVMAELMREYTHNACIYQRGNGSATLLDTLSISFYMVSDTIPVFDKKPINGVGVELLLTNSMLTINNLNKDTNNYVHARYLFSKHEDNVFSIDGDKIKRSFTCSIGDAMEQIINSSLKRYTPDDTAFKKVKSNNKER